MAARLTPANVAMSRAVVSRPRSRRQIRAARRRSSRLPTGHSLPGTLDDVSHYVLHSVQTVVTVGFVTTPRILISGAGIAGNAPGVALGRRGITATVLERAGGPRRRSHGRPARTQP